MFLGSLEHDCLVINAKHKIDETHSVPRQTRHWADRGLIHCEDSLDNSYVTMSVLTFLRQIKGICDMLGNSSSKDDTGPESDLRAEIQRINDKAIVIARKAQEQGMPDDASARRDLVRRRPTTVAMTSGAIM